MASSMVFAAGDLLGSALVPWNVPGLSQSEMFGLRSKRRCCGHDWHMPTISRFFGIAIIMFFDDHGFPHFHARHPEGEAKVRIDNLEVMDSDLGRRQLRFVLAWAELHQEELEENWRRARAGETLLDIEPLK
ncbi:MAG TPA: DUF4160 domain-containing protein [Solirubrobacterales bacterium]|jgi:hypothetical protein|nr:DUF4160 domain-containing protein [Solirubrobacterales bacterium]